MSFNKETGMYEGYIYKITNDINDKVYIGQTITTLKDRWHGHMSSALNEKRYTSALYRAMRKYGRNKFHIEEVSCYTEYTKEDLISILNIEEQKYIKKYKSLVSQNGYNIEKGGINKSVPGKIVHKYDLNLNHLSSYESCEEAGRQNNINGSVISSCCNHNAFTAGGYVWAFDGELPTIPYCKSQTNKEYDHIQLSQDAERWRRLLLVDWNGQRIFQYNSYGELINIYKDIIEASELLGVPLQEIRLNLDGKNLCFGKTVLRNENDSFDKYPRSTHLQPITLYDLHGNFVCNFETKRDAELFLDVSSGEVTKVLKRGGSCKGYLISEYGTPLQRKLHRWEKQVLMYDENNNVVKEFSTIKDVSRYFNITDCHNSLNKAIKNKTKYRGYYWKYKEEFAITA